MDSVRINISRCFLLQMDVFKEFERSGFGISEYRNRYHPLFYPWQLKKSLEKPVAKLTGRGTHQEANYEQEAKNAQMFAENFGDDPTVKIPKADPWPNHGCCFLGLSLTFLKNLRSLCSMSVKRPWTSTKTTKTTHSKRKQKMMLSFCYLENFDRDDLEVITMEWGHLDFLEPSWRTTGEVMWDKVFRCNSSGRWIDGLKSTDLAGLRQHMVELD